MILSHEHARSYLTLGGCDPVSGRSTFAESLRTCLARGTSLDTTFNNATKLRSLDKLATDDLTERNPWQHRSITAKRRILVISRFVISRPAMFRIDLRCLIENNL